MRRRGSALASDGGDGDSGRRRQPFRPLQPPRSSRSPTQPALKPTPPREVILTPRATPKPVKRKAASRSKRAATKVKSEPPEIDVSRVRPPSPSDDPLLLSGARSPPLRARFTPAFSSSPPSATCADPPVSFVARLSGARIGGSVVASTSSPDAVDMLPAFTAPRAVVETSPAWSDSDDDDGFNLTGEYTGKFKILTVPTKADLSTKERVDSWGRPVSPFPFSAIMEHSLPLSEVTEDDAGRQDVFDSMMLCDDLEPDVWEAATEPPPSDIEPSPPPSVSEDEYGDFDVDFSMFDMDAESTRVRPFTKPRGDSEQSVMEEEEEEEEEALIDRELSVIADDCVPPPVTEVSQPAGSMDGNSSEEEDDVEGEDIIKITSEDPKAAARAAAILRMHDYDCILAAERKKRSNRSTKPALKRRKTIENAGIRKSYVDSRSQPWKTLQGTSPGSRSLPLLDLWRDAEDSVFFEHQSMSYCDASFTLSPLKTTTTCPQPTLPPPGGKWNRDCWKRLDKCLVAERLAVAASHGLGTDVFADMGDISKDAVLDRFANQVGGESVLTSLGPDWSRDNLIMRLNVLVKKQSRRETRAPVSGHKRAPAATEPRYRELFKEAVALSGTPERCPTSTSLSSDTTVVFDRRGARATLPDPSPPLSWQTSHVRDPIRTPSRTPDPRPSHPKDQVHLRRAASPQKSMIPVPVRPKRLVDLRHLSPIKADRGALRPTARRSSGCSVRELVRQFEDLDK